MKLSKKSLIRFIKYSSIGGSTFALDLFLLYLFTDYFGINYLISAGFAFAVSITIHYYFSRKIVFPCSMRPVGQAYFIFVAIAVSGLFLVVAFMAILVENFNFEPITARLAVAGFVGIYNYLLNLFFNFKVAGPHFQG